ncbi:MAG: hypothetical protein KGI80_01750 [Verrucomicrobiota bacterium]|nr:hypothetical protein [Verrucomicrobiota bacterium]
MKWEELYLEALIGRLQPFGHVLEIGFSLGYSSKLIQTARPTHHTIIEVDPEVAEKAAAWASHYSDITVIEGD